MRQILPNDRGPARSCAVTRQRSPRLGRDIRGVVFVEYVVLVAFVAAFLAAMLVALGPPVVAAYSGRRGTLYSHSP